MREMSVPVFCMWLFIEEPSKRSVCQQNPVVRTEIHS